MASEIELTELEKEAYDLISDCLKFSSIFLRLPEKLEIGFVPFSSGLFEHKNVPCFTTGDGRRIIFNTDWLKRSLPDHVEDVRFFAFHELRHVHQKNQIVLQKSGLQVDESSETINRWNDDFAHYTTNQGDAVTQEQNLQQEVEKDANAYALALINMYHIGEDWEAEFSLPEEAFAAADDRSREYYSSRPELKRFIAKVRREKTGQNPVGKRPDAYSLCPCGSGKKFKFCCYKKGIYD